MDETLQMARKVGVDRSAAVVATSHGSRRLHVADALLQQLVGWWGTVERMRVASFVLALALLASCGEDGHALPDSGDAGVMAVEEELERLVSAARDGAECAVRLLGESDGSSFVWAECSGPSGGVSAPMRIDGAEVQVPGDGSLYEDGVRRLFPAGLADLILDHPDRVRFDLRS